jgi:hypothetical protein
MLFYYLEIIKSFCFSEDYDLLLDLQYIYRFLYSFSVDKTNFPNLKNKIIIYKKKFEKKFGKQNCTSNYHLLVFIFFKIILIFYLFFIK